MKSKYGKRNKILVPVILFIGVIALTIGALILAQNLRRARIEGAGEYATQDEIPRLTAEEAIQAVQNDGAVLLDTRSEAQFQALHAAGAINIPVNEMEARVDELDPETWYIPYCT